MSFRTLVIVNPASANGATGRRWPELRAALDKVLDRWDNQFTVAAKDATRLARQGVLDGYEMIVAVGGDGTMNEVVTGLFPEGEEVPTAPIRSDLILSPVRQGTGGDFARFLGLPGTLPASVAHLAGDKTQASDLGVVSFVDHEGRPAWRGFLNIASFGLSGLVVEKVNHTTKALGGKASFFLGLGRALVGYRPQAVRVEVDGAPFYEGTLVTCACANGQYFGGGMHFAPQAILDDGQFDVVIQTKSGVKEIVSVGDLYSGKAAEWSSVRTRRGARVVAEPGSSGDVVLLDVDGEQPGRLPARFDILPKAVRLKVP
ncbi:MAG: diacylglycerol kinase family protein [Myxococcota bacterium]